MVGHRWTGRVRREAAVLALVAAVVAGNGCTAHDDGVRIVTETLPDGVVGAPYGPAALEASFSGTTRSPEWSLRSDSGPLPDGLLLGTLSSVGVCLDGHICGTPSRPGTWSFIIDVVNGHSEDSKTLSITVHPAGGGTGTLHVTWTVEGGLDQCRDRTVKLMAGTVSTHPCTDGAASLELPTHTYPVTLTLLETNGEVSTFVQLGDAIITDGTTVEMSADFVDLFPGSAQVAWTVSGAAAATGCAASGIANIDMSFSDTGTFPLGTLVPCADGSHLFPVLAPRDFTMRAMPLRADGSCFRRADTTCVSVTAPASVRSAARTVVAFDVPAMVGSVAVRWTIDGVPPSAQVCASAGAASVRVSVVPVGGSPFATRTFACTDGTGSFDVPAGLDYQLDADVILTDGSSADRRNTVPFFVDYGAVVDAPVLPFVLAGGCPIEDLGAPLGAVVPGNTAYVAVGRVPLVLDGQGNPWIATLERDPTGFYFTFVRKWNGSDWEAVGPGIPYGSSGGFGGLAALILDAQGQPVVAAIHYPPGAPAAMQVVRFDGSVWQDLGLPITQPLGGASLARAPSGDIVVAWPGTFPTVPYYRLEIARYASGAWHTLADAPALQRQSVTVYDPSVAVTPLGEVVVAWFETGAVVGGPVHPTFVDKLMGTLVTPLGDELDPTPNAVYPYPSVAVDPGGTIYVAYAPTQPGQYSTGIQVTRWTGSSWQNVGDLVPGNEGDAYPPYNLTIHPLTHQPVVGAPYRYNGAQFAAGVWTFDGAAWNQLCRDLIDYTLEASVAVDAQGRYVIAGQVLTGVQTGVTIVRRVTP